jgi:predicted acyltransferase
MLSAESIPQKTLPSVGPAGQPVSTRVVSVDIFRGLTMALMIFVNDLSSVHGLSRWTYHMPTDVDAMSYVDMVFPAFLFIVGMAMPLAIGQRLRRDPSVLALWIHVLGRTFALLVLGLILANGEYAAPARMYGIPGSLWTLAGIFGAVLAWGVFGKKSVSERSDGAKTSDFWRARWQKMTGFAILIACFAIFRRNLANGNAAWIDFNYPEILGLLGLTYLGACLLYIPMRSSRWAPLGWIVALLAFDAACMAKVISIAHLPMYIWPFDNGSMPSITMAGILAYFIFLDQERPWTPGRRIWTGLGFGAAALVAGWLMVPFGISKNRGTPTWSLWSIAACVIIFSGLYWLCDVRKHTAWAAPVRAAGSNTLLTYLLPDIYVYTASLFGFTALLLHWNHGWPGVLRAVLFTCAMLALSTLLTRAQARMQL